jgi:hypothetical protein
LRQRGGKPCRLRIDDDRAVRCPAVFPVAGGRLRIKIDDQGGVSHLPRGNGERNG